MNGNAVAADVARLTLPQPVGDIPAPPDALPPSRPWYASLMTGDVAALWPAAVIAFGAVLAIGFTMSYHGLFVFGDVIMHWAVALCALAPVGVDVFSMVTLLATFLTHDAHWRVRAYMWIALGCTVAVSVAGNALAELAVAHAAAAKVHQDFVWGYQQYSSVAGAAIWPCVYALALHVLIVVRRHLDQRGDKIKKLSQRVADEAAAEQLLRARAIELAAGGATAAAIVTELDLDPTKLRTVQRWTEPIRAALAAASATPPAKPTTRRVTRTEKPS